MAGAFLDLAGYGVFPFFQFAVANKLPSAIAAMDKNYICPKFDPHNYVGRNVEEFGNFSNGEVEVSAGLNESV